MHGHLQCMPLRTMYAGEVQQHIQELQARAWVSASCVRQGVGLLRIMHTGVGGQVSGGQQVVAPLLCVILDKTCQSPVRRHGISADHCWAQLACCAVLRSAVPRWRPHGECHPIPAVLRALRHAP